MELHCSQSTVLEHGRITSAVGMVLLFCIAVVACASLHVQCTCLYTVTLTRMI